jgi:hypothetical protein
MKPRVFRHLAVIGITMLVLDWIMGAMCAAGTLPHWVFLLSNLPFGALYVWMESSWVGTRYEMFGRTIGDIGSGLVFLFTVMAQSLAYTFLYEWWRIRQDRRASAG